MFGYEFRVTLQLADDTGDVYTARIFMAPYPAIAEGTHWTCVHDSNVKLPGTTFRPRMQLRQLLFELSRKL